MTPTLAFNLQFLSAIFFSLLVARWYLGSDFKIRPLRPLILPLVSIHVLRTIGLVYLTAGTLGIDPALPGAFLYPTAYGDLFAAALAVVVVLFLMSKNRSTYIWVWIFNIVGFLDLVLAVANGIHIRFLAYHVGVAWFLPAFIVPVLLVSHLVIFYLLVKHPDAKRA